MKEINIYFGKHQEGIFGDVADIIKLEPISNEEAEDFVNRLINDSWASVNVKNGIKVIRAENILWFDVVEIEDEEEEDEEEEDETKQNELKQTY